MNAGSGSFCSQCLLKQLPYCSTVVTDISIYRSFNTGENLLSPTFPFFNVKSDGMGYIKRVSFRCGTLNLLFLVTSVAW